MIVFIIIAVILTALALAFVLIPLLQHQENTQSNDIAKSGKWAAPVLAIVVPFAAISIYLLTGNYHAIDLSLSSNEAQANVANHPPMEVLVERLAQRMQSNPDDLKGWLMLGRSALVLGQEQRAKNAYAQAMRLSPKEPEVLLDYANALSELNKSFAGQPYELITAALAISSNNPRALWMMGLAEFENSAYSKALEYWSKLQTQLPPQGKEAIALEKLIMEAKQRIK